MAPTPAAQIDATVAASPLLARYGAAIDRDSAREMLATRLEAATRQAEAEQRAVDQAKADAEFATQQAAVEAQQAKAEKKAQAEYEKARRQSEAGTGSRTRSRPQKTVLEEVLGSAATKTILTGIVTGIFGTRRRR